MNRLTILLLTCMLMVGTVAHTRTNQWIPVTGADELKEFMSGLKAERTLAGGEISRGKYFPDGTGVLSAWGADIPRTWEVKGDDQICVSARGETLCYFLERNSDNPDLYRARDVASGTEAEFKVTEGGIVVKGEPKDAKGGAATASADEIAAELANPNTAVATLTLKTQYRWFTGDLPDAGSQSSPMLLFQPSFPFKLASGDMVLWRPALPLFIDQPVFDANTATFSGETGLGDFAFDLAYAPKLPGGWLIATG